MKDIYVQTFHFSRAQKTKILKIDPTLTVIVWRNQLVHIGIFGFSDSLSPKLCQ